MKKSSGSPSEGASTQNSSRRKFLVGAGASVLALPFLNRAAQAQVCGWNGYTDPAPPQAPGTNSCNVDPSTGECCTPIQPPGSPVDTTPGCANASYVDDGKFLIRGCCSDTVCGYNAAGINVSGIRHYCANGTVPSAWPARPNLTPGQTGPFFCMSIYPTISGLMSKPMGSNQYDAALHSLFSNASGNGPYGRDMLSCWHEVAGINSKRDLNNQLITGTDEKKMQDYLLEFRQCYGYTAPAIGAIECDNGDADYGVSRISDFVTDGLDFVANDLYYNNQYDPVPCLTAWDNQWGNAAGKSATISVAECNVSEHYDWRNLRPLYFNRAANWLFNQGNKTARCFLTFWRYDGYVGLSGPWISGATDTIDALKAIGGGTFTNPSITKEAQKNSALCWANGLS